MCGPLPDSSTKLRPLKRRENAAPDCNEINSFASQKSRSRSSSRYLKKAAVRQFGQLVDLVSAPPFRGFQHSLGSTSKKCKHLAMQHPDLTPALAVYGQDWRSAFKRSFNSPSQLKPERTSFDPVVELNSVAQCRPSSEESSTWNSWNSNGSYFSLGDQAKMNGSDLMQLLALSEQYCLTTRFAIWFSWTGPGFPLDQSFEMLGTVQKPSTAS